MNPATVPNPPAFQQWQNFVPQNTQPYNPFDIYHDSQITNQNIYNSAERLMSNMNTDSQFTNQNLYNSTHKLMSGQNDATQYLTANVNGVSKDLSAASLGIRDSIERGNLVNGNAIERTAGDIKLNSAFLDSASRQHANESTQYLTANINGVSKDLSASSLGLRDAIERGNLVNGNAIERTAGDIKLNSTIIDAASRQAASDSFRDVFRNVDANGSMNNATTERVGSNLNSTVERTAAQMERLAGEGRVTTTVTDAASRQANNDNIRDVLRAVAISDSAIERTAGETRSNFLNSSNGLSSIINDSRKSITDQVNRGTNELVGIANSNTNLMSGLINTAASDSRVASNINLLEQTKGNHVLADQSSSQYANILLDQQKTAAILAQQSAGQYANVLLDQQKTSAILAQQSAGQYSNVLLEQQKTAGVLAQQSSDYFSNVMLEQQKTSAGLAQQSASHYASTMLEHQKSTAVLSHENSNHFSGLLLDQHRMKEYLANKGDSHFAMNQLELQKVKEGLAYQAAQNFASLQLEAAKSSGLISAQLAEAKYDSLKNTQFLADKICECCCEVKMKIENVDRDRLRDNLIVEKGESNLLKVAEFLDRRGDRGDNRDRRFFGGPFDGHHHGETR
jgi:hypothetical protein